MINSLAKFYRNLYKGKLFIIKVGGKVITDEKARENLIANIQKLTNDGIKILLIYGGGEAIDNAISDAGLKTTKINGRRISSARDIEIIKKVLSCDIGFKVSESLVKFRLTASVFNSIPYHWAIAKRRPKINDVTRFDGTLSQIDPKAISNDFKAKNLIICPCLAFTTKGAALNINADNVAIELAVAAKASKLILLTDTDGVIVDGKVKSVLSAREIEALITDKIVTGGMQVKMENCVSAVRSGVKRIHILNGFTKDVLKQEIYTSRGTGTMIVRHNEKKRYLSEEVQQ